MTILHGGVREIMHAAAAVALASLSAAPLPLPARSEDNSLVLRSNAGSPLRYVSAQGERAFVGGYGADGLELWAYPVQLFRDYGVAFRRSGSTAILDGRELLSAIETGPDHSTRIYVGPGFVVRETLFVPVDRPAAILTYQVEGATPVEIEVRAKPVLDLMWPAGMGGQSVAWSDALRGYVLSEPAMGFEGAIASPQIAAHDNTDNARLNSSGGDIAFTLIPDQSHCVQVFVALNESRGSSVEPMLAALRRGAGQLQASAAAHWEQARANGMNLITPDEQVNLAFAWAEMAIEQAWVCNPDLGCGFVGGYGPSHPVRRPQYDWFFAGDGLIAADAAADDGDLQLARRELEFVLRYRDEKTGMIWHELSQSAGLIDWKGKYPYMFVHVDITFQFLSTVARYVQVSGDMDFVNTHWDALLAAYRYCASLIDPATALPRIPADKEAANEQDRMADDLGLSTAWVEAAAGFARLAELKGREDLTHQAQVAEQAARAAIPNRYWSADRQFWINGHTVAGTRIEQLRSGPADALDLNLFGSAGTNALLDKLASSDFQTDWGVRSLSAGSQEYDPESYAKGSVWPIAGASLAASFWRQHRPITAFEIWRNLLAVAELDAPGHLHEVLSGEVFAPQGESVPEQTWSSAGLVSATVHGLLGLAVDSIGRRISFAPRFPGGWTNVRVDRLRVGNAQLSLAWERTEARISLQVTNDGEPIRIEYLPQMPLGATLHAAGLNGTSLAARQEDYPQETRAKIEFIAPHGKSDVIVNFSGGVSISIPRRPLIAGDSSSGLRIIDSRLDATSLKIDAEAPCGHSSRIVLQSPWKLMPAAGAQIRVVAPASFEAVLPAESCPSGTYRPAHIEFGIQR
jgi:glycogen debranching enzyme